MNEVEKLNSIFAPLDVLHIVKTYEYLSPVNKVVDIPVESLYEDAKKYLHCGEYSDRNLTWWHVFKGEDVDPHGEEWKNGILNFFRLTSTPIISKLDNENDHISLDVKFELLVINARKLPIETFQGIKCAIVKTSFGDFPLTQTEEGYTT
mgnify:CR=1 FL=1|tara:strand:+ start:7080 stop:7529 length:450 start_codon:yes stop_codon:yes gene_type:complete